jgi:PKD repeat protein
MLRTRTRRTAIATLLALAGLSPGVAQAAGFLPSTPVHLSTDVNPSLAIDATGDTLFAWQHKNVSPTPDQIQGALHATSATGFVELPDFSTDTTSMHGNDSPVIVTNRAGNGIVAWINSAGGTQQIQLRPISPGGAVGAVQPIGGSITTDTGLTAAINDNGDAVLAWLTGGNTVQASTRQGLAGAFTAVKTLTPPAGDQGPRVAIDGAGNSIVVWKNLAVIDGTRHLAGDFTTWQPTETALMGGSDNFTDPVVAANPAGQMVVAFERVTAVTTLISDVTGTVSAGWGTTPTIGTLSAPGVTHGPAATVDDNGGAAVGWSLMTAIQVSLRPAGGTFPASPTSVAPVPSIVDDMTLAGNGHGAVIVAWYTNAGGVNNVVRAAVKPAGAATFGASQVVSDPARESNSPIVAVDQNGDGVVGFQLGSSGSPLGVGQATYDNTPPTLGAITGPASVKQNSAAAFSDTASDAFSAVTLSWSFGDGTPAATGASVSHTYTKAGTFTVTLTATDQAGNTSSVTHSITVTPATPPPVQVIVATFGNQRITLTTPSLQACTTKTGRLSATLTSSAIAHSRRAKLRFASAAFYLDRGVRHTRKVTRRLRSGRTKKVTVVSFSANATTRHLPATVALRVTGLRSGTHTLKVVLTYSERVKRHRRSITVRVTKTITARFRVC